MPNARNAPRGEQWDLCQRCGIQYPMSRLVLQKGLLVCLRTCFDNLQVERRQFEIERVLGEGENFEGADMRVVDRAFFDSFDEAI